MRGLIYLILQGSCLLEASHITDHRVLDLERSRSKKWWFNRCKATFLIQNLVCVCARVLCSVYAANIP